MKTELTNNLTVPNGAPNRSQSNGEGRPSLSPSGRMARSKRKSSNAAAADPHLESRLINLRPMKRVLITGGAGFVGTNLAAHLASSGVRVRVFDNLSRHGVEQNAEWLTKQFGSDVTIEQADVRDADRVTSAVGDADAVFHLAAQVAVTTSLDDPCEDFEVNARGTLNILEACRSQTVPPMLLFTSTNKVYGGLADLPLQLLGWRHLPTDESLLRHGLSESSAMDFHSPYGCSKGAADQYVVDYARCYRLPTVVLRMSCIYGPHQCGTEDQGWIAHFARSMLSAQPITIYGDGYQVRDVLYVEDLVRAMTAAHRHIRHTAGRAFNIGGGPDNAVSLRGVVDRLTELHGEPPELRYDRAREGDQRYYVSDTRALQRATGWQPMTSAEDGIARLYRWLAENPVSPQQVASAE